MSSTSFVTLRYGLLDLASPLDSAGSKTSMILSPHHDGHVGGELPVNLYAKVSKLNHQSVSSSVG